MFKYVYIEITNVCNLNCTFCKGSKRPKDFMSVDSFKEILDKIKGYTKYINLHVLGEPLMHPEIDDILRLAEENNFKVNITTNGKLLDDNVDVINKCKSVRQVNISLHSFNNISDIKDLIEVVDKIRKDCYISLRLWNLKSKNNNDEVINLLSNHYNKKMGDKNDKLEDNIYLDFEEQFKWPDINDDIRSEEGTCYGLRTHIAILVDGTVVPCCLDSDGIINLGNILKDDLKDILEGEKSKNIKKNFQNRKLCEDLCKRCSYIKRFDISKRDK